MSKIEELKMELEYCQKQYEVAKNNFDICKENLEDAQMNFRIEEVERVLTGIGSLISIGEVNKRDLDRYITHCLNCLHGNIDGTIISIDEDVEKAREKQNG